jgi:hypothetical protein
MSLQTTTKTHSKNKPKPITHQLAQRLIDVVYVGFSAATHRENKTPTPPLVANKSLFNPNLSPL